MCLSDNDITELRGHMIAVGMGMGLSYHDAEEQAQIGILRVWNEANKTPGRNAESCKGLSRTVARNLAIDLQRKELGTRRGGKRTIFCSETAETVMQRDSVRPDDTDWQECLELLEDNEANGLVIAVVQLIVECGYSKEEASEELGIGIDELETHARMAIEVLEAIRMC